MRAHEPLPPIPGDAPNEGEVWAHRTSGQHYTVIGTGYNERDLHVYVAYRSDAGVLWFRWLPIFCDRFWKVSP